MTKKHENGGGNRIGLVLGAAMLLFLADMAFVVLIEAIDIFGDINGGTIWQTRYSALHFPAFDLIARWFPFTYSFPDPTDATTDMLRSKIVVIRDLMLTMWCANIIAGLYCFYRFREAVDGCKTALKRAKRSRNVRGAIVFLLRPLGNCALHHALAVVRAYLFAGIQRRRRPDCSGFWRTERNRSRCVDALPLPG